MLLRVVDNLVISFKMEHLEYEAADESRWYIFAMSGTTQKLMWVSEVKIQDVMSMTL